MLAVERQAQIRTITDQQAFVSVHELCRALNVSEITIRRDLDQMEKQGGLRRTHGGAMSIRSASDAPYVDRAEREVGAKREIGRTAAALVRDGEVIFLNAGSTILAMARALVGRRNVTIVTNAYVVIPILVGESGIQLIQTGGEARQQTGSMVGPIAERTVSELRVDRAFLGATGVDREVGFTNSSLEEAALQRAVMHAAQEVYVLADHTKFGKVSFTRVGPLSLLTGIVTDQGVDATMRDAFAATGVQIIQPSGCGLA